MKKIKWTPLLLAFLGTICLIGIGISVAEESIIGVFTCIILIVAVMGIGFMKKKKMRESETL